MIKQEIKEFLKAKPGYLKEGGRRLRDILSKRGFKVTIKDCKKAIREVLFELRTNPTLLETNEKPKILFYDIEVSYGLARVWRPGYNLKVDYTDFEVHPKIICISWKWNDSDEVHSVDWGTKQDDKELLQEFIKELNKSTFIVHHNGDKFDLPWIRTRALYHNLSMLPKYTSVDTLKLARYHFRFPSNRLDHLGDYLQLGRKVKVDRDLWVDTINGDEKALEDMVTYCNQDVFLLEEIYNKLSTMTLPTVHAGVLNDKVKQTSPYSGGRNLEVVKRTATRAGTIKYLMKCLDTNRYFEMSNADYKKYKESL